MNFMVQEMMDDDGLDAFLMDLLSSSNEDEEEQKQWGGSRKGRAPNKERDFAGAYAKLVKDYFSGPNSVHDEADFERRFRMPRSIFNRISDALMGKEPLSLIYFGRCCR